MPLSTAAIGLTTEPIVHSVDARWTMAYSACLGDTDAVYLDTSRAGGVVAHPLFAICPEWPVALASRKRLREQGLTAAEFQRAVHATHDTHIHRLVRPGDVLSTVATIIAAENRRPGAYVTSCFDTHDQHGALVCRTFNGMLLRGVELQGAQNPSAAAQSGAIEVAKTPHELGQGSEQIDQEIEIEIAANFAHVYTECARIWNPIHTDEAVAKAAGLPTIILHGSAPLALATSAIVRAYADGDPTRVKRIDAQFRAMVLQPARLKAVCFEPVLLNGQTIIAFELTNADHDAVIKHGSVVLQ